MESINSVEAFKPIATVAVNYPVYRAGNPPLIFYLVTKALLEEFAGGLVVN